MNGYDSHYAVVRPRNPSDPYEMNYVPCNSMEYFQTFQVYDEIVIARESQLLPRYIVFVKPK